MKKTLVLLVALLSGCSSAPQLFTSDGRPTTQISCTGGWQDCGARATALCGAGGYDILKRNDSDDSRSVLIACRQRPLQ